jgi:hypothetical protein
MWIREFGIPARMLVIKVVRLAGSSAPSIEAIHAAAGFDPAVWLLRSDQFFVRDA